MGCKMELFKILGICLVSAVLALILSSYKKEYAFFISVAAGVLIFGLVLRELINPVTKIFNTVSSYGIKSSYILIAVKALAIGHITQFVADTCRDFSQGAIAAKAEFAGKAAVFLIALPLISDLFQIIGSLVS